MNRPEVVTRNVHTSCLSTCTSTPALDETSPWTFGSCFSSVGCDVDVLVPDGVELVPAYVHV